MPSVLPELTFCLFRGHFTGRPACAECVGSFYFVFCITLCSMRKQPESRSPEKQRRGKGPAGPCQRPCSRGWAWWGRRDASPGLQAAMLGGALGPACTTLESRTRRLLQDGGAGRRGWGKLGVLGLPLRARGGAWG